MKYATMYMNAVLRYHERNEAKVIPRINENRFRVLGDISNKFEDML
jgi:hypothetical protein